MTQPVRFHKYANRRLYNIDKSRYATLPEIQAVIESGHTISVRTRPGFEDITVNVLLEVLQNKERDKPRIQPETVIKLIRNGSTT